MAAATLHLRLRRLTANLNFFSSAAEAAVLDDGGGDTVAFTVGRLKQAIRRERDPDRLASMFSSPPPSVAGDRRLYGVAVSRLAASGRRDLVDVILSSSLSCPTPSTGLILRAVSLYGAAGMPESAESAFRRLGSHSDASLSALLDAYYNSRRFDLAKSAFPSLPKELGIAPGVVSYNAYLKSVVADGDVASARRVLDEMETEGVAPDIATYNEVLKGCLKKNDEAAFHELIGVLDKKRIKYNVTTFGLRMALLCRQGKAPEAAQLLHAMAKRNIQPNRFCYNTVIRGLCTSGEADAAMAVFEKMEENSHDRSGLLPNCETYIPLMKVLVEKGSFESALKVYRKCLRKRWAPPFPVVTELIEGLMKTGEVEKAKEVAEKMNGVVKGDAADMWKKVRPELS